MLLSLSEFVCVFFLFFNDTATTEIYTLSLHDALPISMCRTTLHSFGHISREEGSCSYRSEEHTSELQSHSFISYAVFCLKKNKSGRDLLHTAAHHHAMCVVRGNTQT